MVVIRYLNKKITVGKEVEGEKGYLITRVDNLNIADSLLFYLFIYLSLSHVQKNNSGSRNCTNKKTDTQTIYIYMYVCMYVCM